MIASGPRCKCQCLTKAQVLAKELQTMMMALDREDREGDCQHAEESLEQERALLADLREEVEAMHHLSEVDRQVQLVTGLSASLQELSATMDRQSAIFNRLVMHMEACPSSIPQSYGLPNPMYLAPLASMYFIPHQCITVVDSWT